MARDLGAHRFRHTVATHMVRRGSSFKEVADVLGHTSLGSTGIYAKLDERSLERLLFLGPEVRDETCRSVASPRSLYST